MRDTLPAMPPRPEPGRDYFFCDECWSWRYKTIGGCPCWGAKAKAALRDEDGGTITAARWIDTREPTPGELEALRRMVGG